MPYKPKPQAIATYDNQRWNGHYLQDGNGQPKKFPSLIVAVTEAEKLNNLPHAPGRSYHVVAYPEAK